MEKAQITLTYKISKEGPERDRIFGQLWYSTKTTVIFNLQDLLNQVSLELGTRRYCQKN